MNSPLVRVILATLGGYLIILLFLSVYDWIAGEYPRRPTKLPDSGRIQHPFYHEESTRTFLAKEFFAKFGTDVLLLETTHKNLKRLINRMDAGRDYFPLLNADIMKILRTVKDKNPNIRIWGIEETKGQQKDSISRDQSIARNFWERFETGRQHIILFGALHCPHDSVNINSESILDIFLK